MQTGTKEEEQGRKSIGENENQAQTVVKKGGEKQRRGGRNELISSAVPPCQLSRGGDK